MSLESRLRFYIDIRMANMDTLKSHNNIPRDVTDIKLDYESSVMLCILLVHGDIRLEVLGWLIVVPVTGSSTIRLTTIMPSIGIDWTTHHISTSLCLCRLLVIICSCMRRAKSVCFVFRVRRRQEIDDEAPHVDNEDQANHPLENS